VKALFKLALGSEDFERLLGYVEVLREKDKSAEPRMLQAMRDIVKLTIGMSPLKMGLFVGALGLTGVVSKVAYNLALTCGFGGKGSMKALSKLPPGVMDDKQALIPGVAKLKALFSGEEILEDLFERICTGEEGELPNKCGEQALCHYKRALKDKFPQKENILFFFSLPIVAKASEVEPVLFAQFVAITQEWLDVEVVGHPPNWNLPGICEGETFHHTPLQPIPLVCHGGEVARKRVVNVFSLPKGEAIATRISKGPTRCIELSVGVATPLVVVCNGQTLFAGACADMPVEEEQALHEGLVEADEEFSDHDTDRKILRQSKIVPFGAYGARYMHHGTAIAPQKITKIVYPFVERAKGIMEMVVPGLGVASTDGAKWSRPRDCIASVGVVAKYGSDDCFPPPIELRGLGWSRQTTRCLAVLDENEVACNGHLDQFNGLALLVSSI
jgi:hypothetical protein